MEAAAVRPAPVFICHASADAGVARRVAEALEERGVSCWIAPRDIPLGMKYADAIVQGIHGCAGMVVLVSGAANGSSFVHREVERADSQRKLLIACLLEDVRPEKGLELFLSATQHVDAYRAGLDEAIDAIAATFRAGVAGAESAPAPGPRRRRPAALVAMLGALALGLVLAAYWWPRPIDPDPLPPDDGSVPADDSPVAAANRLMAAARVGEVESIRALFSEQGRARHTLNQWTATAAKTLVELGSATAPAEIVLEGDVPRRMAMLGDGRFSVVVAERPFDGGHLCEQVVVREEPSRWSVESYQYWMAVDGRCPREADLQAATERAHELLATLQADGGIAPGDYAAPLSGIDAQPQWATLLGDLNTRLANWSSRDHLVGAAAVPGNLAVQPGGAGIPGRFVLVRFAVDNGGMRTNLDLFMQHEADGRWRLAGIYSNLSQ